MQDSASPFIYTPPMRPYLTLLHQDEDILLLDKQSGLLTVRGKPDEHADCLERRVRDVFPTARIVHRLDRDTSGIIIMAMNPRAHRHLGLQFERRKTTKTYIARVWGHVAQRCGRIDAPIACDWPNRPKQMIDPQGRDAITDWEVIAHEGKMTRLRLFPLTGRSHQLRVHLQSIGHPIAGDVFYAEGAALHAAPRLQLHAETLTIHHPANGKRQTFSAACPF